MALSVPELDAKQIADAADAFNSWLPCPYQRSALLGWVEASMMLWALTRQIRPDLSDDFVLAMARNQYREWVEETGDYQPETSQASEPMARSRYKR